MAHEPTAAEVIPAKFQQIAATGAKKELAVAAPELQTPNAVSQQVGLAVMTEIAKDPNITLTPIAPMRNSVQGWAAVAGGISVVGNYAPQILSQFGVNINGGLADAIEAATHAVGLPAGTGTASVVVFTLGAFVVVWVRRKWFSHTVTPEAANRAIDQGKAI